MDPVEAQATLQNFSKIIDSLRSESDRGCILVVSSMLEKILEEQITKRLIPKYGKEDELMGKSNSRPISGFSAKINLAYRIGLIPDIECKMLHQLRELRNDCAHKIEQQDFEANHFKDRTKNIIEHSKVVWDAILTHIAPKLFPDEQQCSVVSFVDKVGWRRSFEVFFALVVAHKQATIERVSPIIPLYSSW